MKRTLAILFLAILAGCSHSPQDKARSLFSHGVKELDQGQTARADSTFRKLMIDMPTSSLGLYGTGLVLERQCQLYDGLGVFLNVNHLDKASVPALMSMGRTFRWLGEYDLAAAAYRECSVLPDSSAVAATKFASVQCDDNQPALALSAISVADSLGADKSFTALIHARALVMQAKRDSAEALYAGTMSRADKSADLLTLAADYLETSGAVDSSVIMSEQATRQSDTRFDHLYAHFQRCLRNKYLWEARRTIDRIAKPDSTNLTRLGLEIQYYLAAGDNFHANRTSDLFLKRGNNSVSSYVYEADVRMRVGDNQTVSQNILIIPSLTAQDNDSSAFARYLQGMVLVRYANAGEPSEIASKLATSSGFLTERLPYRLTWLRLLYSLGATELSKPAAEQMLAAHGNDANWLTGFGNVWSDRSIQNLDEADRAYRKALQIDPGRIAALRNLVGMYMRTGAYEKALAVTNEFRALVESHADLALDRAYCLAQTGQYEIGATEFQNAIPKLKGDMGRVERMSRLLGSKGRQDLDGSLIKLTVQLNPNNPDALLLAAMRDNDYGSAQSALESAEQGLAIEPTNVGLAVQKARAVHGKGDRQSAYAQFEDLLKKEGGNVAVNLYFSAMLASDQEQLPRAENLARTAHYWEQGTLRTVANLSFVYLQNGRYDMAAAESMPMTAAHPDWSETQYLCGAALYMQGMKEAREYLQKGLDLGLPPQYRDKAKEFLAKL